MRVCRSLRVIIPALALTTTACDHGALGSECDLVVLNTSSCGLSIWVDDHEAFAVHPDTDRTLGDIAPGRHVLEALDPGGRLVHRRTVELQSGEDSYWTLDHC